MLKNHHNKSDGIGKILTELNFVVFISMVFLVFYIIAIYWSFNAYKEFKGALEDQIGA